MLKSFTHCTFYDIHMHFFTEMRRKHGSIAPSSLAAAAVGVQQIMAKMNNRMADQTSLTAGERRGS
jgi:hypothetical protein